MRYLPQTTGSSASFNESQRPPLDQVPEALAAKILERDRLMGQRASAQTRVIELGTEQQSQAARQADDDAAAAAAREGKAIPAPAALPKLEKDRAAAARALTAQEAAFREVTTECEDLASTLYWANVESNASDRAKLRTEIAERAADLADAVQAAVDQFAVVTWMRTGVLNRSTMTWPSEILDLERYGLNRLNVTPVNVRDVIIAAATTCLDEPND